MNPPIGLTNAQHKHAYKIAKHLSERKAEDKAEISAVSLALVRDIGSERFAKIVMFYVDQVNRSPAAKSAGPGFLHGGTVGIEDGHRLLIRATYDRLKREAQEAFYAFLLENLPADVIVWGCLYDTGDQETALNDGLLIRTKPDKDRIKRDIARVKDRSLHLDRTIEGNSESDDEHPSLGPVVDLDALEESSESNQDGGEVVDDEEEESSASEEPETDHRRFLKNVVDRLSKRQKVQAHSFELDLVEDEDLILFENQSASTPKDKKRQIPCPPAPIKRIIPTRRVKAKKALYAEAESSSAELSSNLLDEDLDFDE
uniref:Uncharacterized protein n=1 Tax=viral metagenome TaxID=1070528 RepID=A0A6C0CI57_9ZZZZ